MPAAARGAATCRPVPQRVSAHAALPSEYYPQATLTGGVIIGVGCGVYYSLQFHTRLLTALSS